VHVECASAYGGSVRCLEEFLSACRQDRYRHVVCLYRSLESALPGLSDDVWLAPAPGRRRRGVAATLEYLIAQVRSAAWFYWRLRRHHVVLVRLNNGPSSHVPAAVGARLAGVPCVAWLRSFPRSQPDRRWRWAMALPSCLVAVSDAVRRSHISFGVSPDRIVTLYDGTRLRSTPPRRAEVSRPFRVGTLGRLVRWKGLLDFVRAAGLVCQSRSNIEFTIAGDEDPDDAGFVVELRTEIERLRLGDRVQLVGFCPDPASYLDGLDCLVQPSEIPEPFGMSILEAMSVGCPVIATGGGGAEEIVEHGRSGLLVPLRSPDALAAAICRLQDEPALRSRLQDGARQRVEQVFLLQRRVAQQEAWLDAHARGHRSIAGGQVAAS
jgi:glycosyltransferase involved in cell wall biosynthesis